MQGKWHNAESYRQTLKDYERALQLGCTTLAKSIAYANQELGSEFDKIMVRVMVQKGEAA